MYINSYDYFNSENSLSGSKCFPRNQQYLVLLLLPEKGAKQLK